MSRRKAPPKAKRPTRTVHEVKAFRADMIPIDPDGKYLLLVDWGPTPQTQKKRIVENFLTSLEIWWSSPKNPVFVVPTFGQPLKLYRVDEGDKDDKEN